MDRWKDGWKEDPILQVEAISPKKETHQCQHEMTTSHQLTISDKNSKHKTVRTAAFLKKKRKNATE